MALGRLGRLSDVKLGFSRLLSRSVKTSSPCLALLRLDVGQWYIPGPCSQAWMECAVQKTCKRWACCTRLVGVRHSAPFETKLPLKSWTRQSGLLQVPSYTTFGSTPPSKRRPCVCMVHSLSRLLHSILANLRLSRGIGIDGAKKGPGAV